MIGSEGMPRTYVAQTRAGSATFIEVGIVMLGVLPAS